jgi:glutamyl-tRNA reductase
MVFLQGIDHHATLDEREAFIAAVRSGLPERYVYLQTCDRAELYYGDGMPAPGVAEHLFRVASGLESKLIGETAIQGQVRSAYRTAAGGGHVSPGLHRLFQRALRVGKKVRAETPISHGTASHARAALALLMECVPDLPRRSVLIVGANTFAEQVLRVLTKARCRSINVTNRTLRKAHELAARHACIPFPMHELAARMATADVVISAVSAPAPIIASEHVPAGRALTLVDFGVPRTIVSELALLPGVTLKNIEDVERHVSTCLCRRGRAVAEAEVIIADAVSRLHCVEPLSRAV